MNFNEKKGDFKSDLYETSKTKKQEGASEIKSALMEKGEKEIKVYDFDKLKQWFCEEFRASQELKSCDAYYQDQYKQKMVIEFKNTHHYRMKEFWTELYGKFIDTHMLLAETFFQNKKVKDIKKSVKLVLVYNDEMNYEQGVRGISAQFNRVQPIKGSGERKTKEKVFFLSEEEYKENLRNILDLFVDEFFLSVEFLDKKVFYQKYIEGSWFNELID